MFYQEKMNKHYNKNSTNTAQHDNMKLHTLTDTTLHKMYIHNSK